MHSEKKEAALVIGEHVKVYRQKKGYTQRGLADLVNVDFTTISKLESGSFIPSNELLKNLAIWLDCDRLYDFVLDKDYLLELAANNIVAAKLLRRLHTMTRQQIQDIIDTLD